MSVVGRPRAVGNVLEMSEIEQMRIAIAQVFQDSQLSIASHRKQIVVLKQIQLKSAELDLEDSFNRVVLNMLNKVLTLKKNETVGDRIIKFVSSYSLTILNKDNSKSNDNQGLDQRNLYERFVDELVIHLMKGLEASNKNVRYRCLQLLSHVLFQIDEISHDMYETLMELLNSRLHDKDAVVRAAAVKAISRFQEGDLENENHISEAAEKLLIVLQNDSSADVRKALLLALEKNGITINYLLERARDSNSVNRRLVFSRIMKDVGDFRTIEYTVREKILAWGLRDREPSVSNAAAKMFAFDWYKTCGEDLMELIARLHVVNSDIAEVAVKVFFQQRPEIFRKISFSSDLWKSLNPETSFLIRCYYQYCNERHYEESIEKNFPEAIELASLILRYLQLRKKFVEKKEEESNLESLDFIIQQLLIVAKDYDYSDEVGRREMFRISRASLTNEFLQDKLIKELLQVLRKISISEKDFCQMITEVITDIRDSLLDEMEVEGEETFHSALSDIGNKSRDKSRDNSKLAESTMNDDDDDDDDEAEKERPTKKPKLNQEKDNQITLQCLIVTKRMLELTMEPLKNHFSIQSLVDSLIKPAIQNSLTQIRHLGIQCLGLVCLIDKQLSSETMFLLGVCVTQSDHTLKAIALKVIFDILSVHGTSGILDVEDGVDSLSLSKLLYRCLKDSENKETQSITAIGICKLYLADILIDNELFETLLLSYFGPTVSDNEVFKQALSFCIPVYSFSHPSHQEKVMKVSTDTFLRSYQLYENDLNDEERLKMTPPGKILEHLIHFTDPGNVVNQSELQISSSNIHLELGIDLFELVNHEDFEESRVFKKTIITCLPKLKITSDCEYEKLEKIMHNIEDCESNIEQNPTAFDLPTKNAFFKFKLSLEKIMEAAEQKKSERQQEAEIKKEDTEESIDLEKAVEEEIERSMIEPKEDDSQGSDSDEEHEQDQDESDKDDEDEGEEILHSFLEEEDMDVEKIRHKKRRALPSLGNTTIDDI